MVVGEGLSVEVGTEVLVGGRFGGGEAGVADLEALEVGADDFDGRAITPRVDFALQLSRFLGEAELGVHLDQLVSSLAAFRGADAVGGRLFEKGDSLGVGGLLDLLWGTLCAFDDDLGGEGVGVHALFEAGEGVGADLLEASQGEVPFALFGKGFDE